MSTRCMIGRVNDNNSVDAVYCHFDGYPTENGVGPILLKNYTREMVGELIKEGGMSVLGSSVDECDFYYDGTDAVHYANVDEFIENGADHDYHYFIDLDGKWYVIVMRYDHRKGEMMSSPDTTYNLEQYIKDHVENYDD